MARAIMPVIGSCEVCRTHRYVSPIRVVTDEEEDILLICELCLRDLSDLVVARLRREKGEMN